MPTRASCLLVTWLIAACGSMAMAAQDLPPGMYVGTPDGPQELAVYAERTPLGRLKPLRTPLADVQTVAGEVRVICNLPHWQLRGVWLATKRVFRDETVERRPLRTDLRRLTMSATFVRIVDSADPARWRRRLADVGASADEPAYVFVTMESDGLVRDFVVGIDMASALGR